MTILWETLCAGLAARRAICGLRGHRTSPGPLVAHHALDGLHYLRPCDGCSKMIEVPAPLNDDRVKIVWLDDEPKL